MSRSLFLATSFLLAQHRYDYLSCWSKLSRPFILTPDDLRLIMNNSVLFNLKCIELTDEYRVG